jgi:hypothetical protein
MWTRHWKLARDPFSERDAPFVATEAHAEAEARLAHAIEAAERSATLLAAPGLGKTLVLSRALEAGPQPVAPVRPRRRARSTARRSWPGWPRGYTSASRPGRAAPWPGNGWPTRSGSAARRDCTSCWPSTTAIT